MFPICLFAKDSKCAINVSHHVALVHLHPLVNAMLDTGETQLSLDTTRVVLNAFVNFWYSGTLQMPTIASTSKPEYYENLEEAYENLEEAMRFANMVDSPDDKGAVEEVVSHYLKWYPCGSKGRLRLFVLAHRYEYSAELRKMLATPCPHPWSWYIEQGYLTAEELSLCESTLMQTNLKPDEMAKLVQLGVIRSEENVRIVFATIMSFAGRCVMQHSLPYVEHYKDMSDRHKVLFLEAYVRASTDIDIP